MVYRILFAALLSTAMGQSVVLTILPSLGREAGLSELQVAIILSSSAFIFAVGATLWSRQSATLGPRKTMIIGLSGYTLGTLLFASVFWAGINHWLTGTALFVALFIARTAQSSVMSATPPSAVSYALTHAQTTKHNPVSALSQVTSGNSLGQILGPAMAGALVGFGLIVPLYAILLLTAAALVWVWRCLPALKTASYSSSTSQAQQSHASRSTVYLLIVNACGLFLCLAVFQQTLGFLLMDDYQLTSIDAAKAAGVAMMCNAVTALFTQLVILPRSHASEGTLLRLSAASLVVGYTLLFLSSSLTQLNVGMAIVGLGMGCGYPVLTAAINQWSAPKQRDHVTGLATAAPAIGYTLGPPISALLYGVSHRTPLAVCIGLACFISLISLFIAYPAKR